MKKLIKLDKYKRKSYYFTHIKVLEVGEEYE